MLSVVRLIAPLLVAAAVAPGAAVVQDAHAQDTTPGGLWEEFPLEQGSPPTTAPREAPATPVPREAPRTTPDRTAGPAPQTDGAGVPVAAVAAAGLSLLLLGGVVLARRPTRARARAPVRPASSEPGAAPRFARIGQEALAPGAAQVTDDDDDVVEIAWRPHANATVFFLRRLADDDGAATSPPLLGAPQARRAHARLVGRLTREGWEPYGHGDAWYASRFRWAQGASTPPLERSSPAVQWR